MESQASLAVGLSARDDTISGRTEGGKESVQRQPILMELGVTELDSILELSCLQLHLHEQTLVVEVCLGEHWPWRAPGRRRPHGAELWQTLLQPRPR
jgi:hypothetical protein